MKLMSYPVKATQYSETVLRTFHRVLHNIGIIFVYIGIIREKKKTQYKETSSWKQSSVMNTAIFCAEW